MAFVFSYKKLLNINIFCDKILNLCISDIFYVIIKILLIGGVAMFEKGDKIFYPMHGAGIIEALEEKEFVGNKQLYYIVTMPLKNMQIMIPINKASDNGIRKIVDQDTLENVFNYFNNLETDLSINHIQRQRININKIRSGDIYEGAEVIRDLVRISKKKSLGTEDRNTLNNAQQILISEVMLVKEIEEDKAVELLNQVINN